MNVYRSAIERAFQSGRNVLPDATDDQAAAIEAWALDVLEDDSELERRFTSPPRPDLFTEPAKRPRHRPSECPDEDCHECIAVAMTRSLDERQLTGAAADRMLLVTGLPLLPEDAPPADHPGLTPCSDDACTVCWGED